MIKQLQLGMLGEKWLNAKSIAIYGFGVVAKKCVNMLTEDFEIPYIIDNDMKKAGTTYNGIPIIPQDELLKKEKKIPIVIIGTIGVYKSISDMLTNAGMKEYEDYCLLDLFVAEWYWHNRKQVHLVEVHTTITTRCTLKCKNCNMFMPYYKNNIDISLENFKEDMDTLFNVADRIFSIGILGGEPLLNKELSDMILYLQETYGNRIGEISIITNGTILPDDKLIEVLKKCNVKVHISNYTSTVPYNKRLEEFEEVMRANEIEYRVNSSLVWCDFGFPDNSFNFSDVRKHMMECFPIFRGINDKKIYFCHVAWSAEKCGLYKLNENDYYDMTKIDKNNYEQIEEFINYSLGGDESFSLSFCKLCGGCGIDNKMYVKAGLQAETENGN